MLPVLPLSVLEVFVATLADKEKKQEGGDPGYNNST